MAGLKEQVQAHSWSSRVMARRPRLRLVSAEAHAIVTEQYQQLNDVILPALAEQGIRFLRRSTWNEAQREWIPQLFPARNGAGIDAQSGSILRTLSRASSNKVSISPLSWKARMPSDEAQRRHRPGAARCRVIQLPEELAGCAYGFVFLSSILHEFVGELFTGMSVLGCYPVPRHPQLRPFVDEEVTNLRTKVAG